MGKLKHAEHGERTLPSRCLVGRSSLAQLKLSRSFVSSEHAVIHWERGAWWLRDLGSKNGTSLNGVAIPPGTSKPLKLNDRIGFGESDEWIVCDDRAPQPFANCEQLGRQRHGEGGLLLLPSEAEPEASVYSNGTSWISEHSGAVYSIASGDVLSLPSGKWSIILPEIGDDLSFATQEATLVLDRLTLEFSVSADEERVQLSLRQGSIFRSLPTRAFLYTLLTLARERLANASAEDAGWVHSEDLAKKLDCSREKLNVDIHRIRQFLQAEGVRNAGKIVERHPETAQVRLGISNVRVAPA